MSSIFGRILCPIGFDGDSLTALRLARRLAQRDHATVYVAHVMSPMYPVTSFDQPALCSGTMQRERSLEVELELERIAEAELGGIAYDVILCSGNSAEQIVTLAADLRADLIVMATHGRKGLAHLFLGSVTEQVVRASSCPVLTVGTKASGPHEETHDAKRFGKINGYLHQFLGGWRVHEHSA